MGVSREFKETCYSLGRQVLLLCAILCLLAAIGIYTIRSTPAGGCTKIGKVESDIGNFLTQLQMYEVLNESFPSTEQGIQALVNQPSGDPPARRWRRLLAEIPIDPWGNAYLLRNPATLSKDRIDVYSAGPDRQPNTADDIGNW